MYRLTDGKRVLEIEMEVWNENEYKYSVEEEFFNNTKKHNHWIDAAFVEDLDYCVDQMDDWKYGRGDYTDELEGQPGHNPKDRWVDVKDVTAKYDHDDISNVLAYV